MIIILAIIAGAGLGYIIERGDLCFHSTLRGLFKQPRQLDLFRAYLLSLLVATPLVYGLIAMGVIDPWIPPFVWQANVVGGVIFGVGMVVAATCITGLFYKLGHGMLGTVVGLVAWAMADIATYRGPLSPLREALNENPVTVTEGQSATVLNLFGPAVGLGVVAMIGAVIAVWLWQSSRVAQPLPSRADYWGWGKLGPAVGLFTAFAWLLALGGGSNYTYGTSGIPSGVVAALTEGGQDWVWWFTAGLVSLIPGALLAAKLSGTLWVRGETVSRYMQLAAGGVLMGIGAAIAGGCNLGHGLVGVPLLSMGSITTVISMAVGVWLADRAVKLWSTRQVGTVEAQSA